MLVRRSDFDEGGVFDAPDDAQRELSCFAGAGGSSAASSAAPVAGQRECCGAVVAIYLSCFLRSVRKCVRFACSV